MQRPYHKYTAVAKHVLRRLPLVSHLVPPELGGGRVAREGGADISPLDVAEHHMCTWLACLYDGGIALGGITRTVRISIEPVPGNALVICYRSQNDVVWIIMPKNGKQ
jgi:hypothetical protein